MAWTPISICWASVIPSAANSSRGSPYPPLADSARDQPSGRSARLLLGPWDLELIGDPVMAGDLRVG